MGAPPNHPTLDHFSLVYYNYIGTYGLGYRHLRKPPNHHLETLSCFLQRAKNWAVQHSPLDQMEASYGGDTLQNTHGWKRLHIQDRKIISFEKFRTGKIWQSIFSSENISAGKNKEFSEYFFVLSGLDPTRLTVHNPPRSRRLGTIPYPSDPSVYTRKNMLKYSNDGANTNTF